MASWDPQEKAAALAMIEAGEFSYREIGERFGRSKNCIGGLATRNGLADPDNNPVGKTKWTVATIKRLKVLYRTGLSPKEIADRLERSSVDVRSKISELRLTECRSEAVAAPLPKALERRPQPCVGPARTCQWIDGGVRRVSAFCGKPALPGSSWCAEHRRRVYLPLPTKRISI